MKQSQKRHGLSPGKTRDPVTITCGQWPSYLQNKKIHKSPRALSNPVQMVEMTLPGSLQQCEHATTYLVTERWMLYLDTGSSCFKKLRQDWVRSQDLKRLKWVLDKD